MYIWDVVVIEFLFYFPLQLRDAHSTQEKIRRALINISFSELRHKIPNLNDKAKHVSKITILKVARSYCLELQSELAQLKKSRRLLIKRQQYLKQIQIENR